jgi:hypothetical protein
MKSLTRKIYWQARRLQVAQQADGQVEGQLGGQVGEQVWKVDWQVEGQVWRPLQLQVYEKLN